MVDKNHVLRLVRYRYGTVRAYLKAVNMSRTRFYFILRNPHRSEYEDCIKVLAYDLDVPIREIIKKEK